MNKKSFSNYSVDLEVFIEFLVEKGYIHIERVQTKSDNIFHRYYKVEPIDQENAVNKAL